MKISLIIAAILLFLSLKATAALRLDDFYKAEDGTNYSPAFTRLFQSPECASGCRIELGCKNYVLQETLKLCKPVVMQGCGERLTSIYGPVGKTGIVVGYNGGTGLGQCTATEGNGAAGSILEGFSVIVSSSAPITQDNPKAFVGIDIKTGTVTLRNIRTQGGLHGVRLSASVTRPGDERSNGNHWRMDMVAANNTYHAPIFIKGPDSNAGVGTAISGVTGCKAAAKIKAFVEADGSTWDPVLADCAGIMDASFLGNTWIGSHVSTIYDWEAQRFEKAYLATGSNQHVVFIGSYAEQSTSCAQISARSISMGGISCFGGAGLTFNDRAVSNIDLIAPTISTKAIGTSATEGIQKLMTWKFPGAEAVDYISWEYDQRHRADGVTPVYLPGHDALSVRINGSNANMPLKWSMK